ncbi:MAG: selenium cofactor biosynthesis protein YqeC [Chloroflexota bacterium]
MDSWKLITAFNIMRKDVVSFSGAGGKTSAMMRMATEAHERGWRVVSTTTTKLGVGQESWAPYHLVWKGRQLDLNKLSRALDEFGHVLLTGTASDDGTKWQSVPSDEVDEIAARNIADLILVEADGARGHSLKVPNEDEPVIPLSSTLVVPVVAIDAVGSPIGQTAHRVERVCALTKTEPSDTVTPDIVGQVILHPQGGCKNVPANVPIRVLINKVEDTIGVKCARQVAQQVLRGHVSNTLATQVDCVVLCALEKEKPVVEVQRRVAAVILAAGSSRRMDSQVPKQLLPWRGKNVIEALVDRVQQMESITGPVVIVVGSHEAKVRDSLLGQDLTYVTNQRYFETELISSLQIGIQSLPQSVDACLVMLADQPWIKAELVDRIIQRYAQTGQPIIAPIFERRRGHPVLFDRSLWAELCELNDDGAPRDVISRHPDQLELVTADDDWITRDMDDWEQYRFALNNAPD